MRSWFKFSLFCCKMLFFVVVGFFCCCLLKNEWMGGPVFLHHVWIWSERMWSTALGSSLSLTQRHLSAFLPVNVEKGATPNRCEADFVCAHVSPPGVTLIYVWWVCQRHSHTGTCVCLSATSVSLHKWWKISNNWHGMWTCCLQHIAVIPLGSCTKGNHSVW